MKTDLSNKKITFQYKELREEPSLENIYTNSVFLRMFADGVEIFSGLNIDSVSYETYEIIDCLSNMVLAIINGEYEFRIDFADDDEEARLSFIKAGRVLQINMGAQYNVVYYLDPKQFIDAAISLLKDRKQAGLSDGKLHEIQKKLKIQRDLEIESDLKFSLEFSHIKNEFYRDNDRLKIQWGNLFLYTDTRHSNIIEELINSAVSLLKNAHQSISINIDDENNDNPLGDEKTEYYRTFSININPSKGTESILMIGIFENPWGEEGIVLTMNEYISAVHIMAKSFLKQYTINEFKDMHKDWLHDTTFPTLQYETLNKLMMNK